MTSRAELVRAGFFEPAQVPARLSRLAAALSVEDALVAGLPARLAAVADPDQALVLLERLAEAGAPAGTLLGPEAGPLLGLLGMSQALGDHLVRHPGDCAAARDGLPGPDPMRERLTCAAAGSADAMRAAYRRELVAIAAHDLASADPAALLDQVTAALSDLAAAALEAGLVIARARHPEAAAARLAVIAMGKCGGRELNYVSDVDVVFVCGEGDEVPAARLATAMMAACSAPSAEPPLWPVDAALRPEGARGALVRTVAGYREYYQRWAKTWEFQALLKARPVAGDLDLGREWLAAIGPRVWEAADRDGFVEDVQAMRRRVEAHLPLRESGRQLKLGPGGLRDIEFSVQLLQLVHGRADESLRDPGTLTAARALTDGGYVAREDGAALDAGYRGLRVLEHRIQLARLRRSHVVPEQHRDLRRLGRALRLPGDPAAAVEARWRGTAHEVRALHERLFYRPLLSAVGRLSGADLRLSPDAARARLAALGFADPAGALRHIEALTSGVSRRAAIQRQLLPALLGWFADGPGPDQGLLAFRRLSDELGTTHWYLKLLRDSGSAAEELAHVLSSSRYAADLLLGGPERVRLLAQPFTGIDAGTVEERMRAAAGRSGDLEQQIAAIRAIRADELVRLVFADVAGGATAHQVRSGLTALADAALRVALDRVHQAVAPVPSADLLLVALGRFGGRELGYASDADVMLVHAPRPGSDPAVADEEALETGRRLFALLGRPGPDPALALDADLRPEGRNGPLSRSVDACAAYYGRWSAGWESQALLRARPCAGEEALWERFAAVIDPLRYPGDGLPEAAVREIRRLKARMEAERLPRGVDPRDHYKLGRGGLSDVEWTVQLVQLRHGASARELRVTSTEESIRAAEAGGHLTAAEAGALRDAWRLASRLRDAGLLWRGRADESLPVRARDAEGVARLAGLGAGGGAGLAEEWHRAGRLARGVVDRRFYA